MRKLLAICSALLVLGCGVEGESAGGPGGYPAPLVETAPVERSDLIDSWSFSATVSAPRSSVLAAAVSGRVQQVRLREGGTSKKGGLLLRLSSGKAVAALEAAHADQTAAAAEAERAASVARRAEALGAGLSEEEREEAQLLATVAAAAKERAAATIRTREEELRDHSVYAPYSLVVIQRMVDEGAWVTPGAPLLEVMERGLPELRVAVPANRLPALAEGMEVRILDGDRSYTGVVEAVVPAVDADTRQGLVRVGIAADDAEQLMPGEPVEVRMDVVLQAQALLVRREALQSGARGTSVIAVVDGKAKPIPVQVTEQAGALAAVSGEGIEAGMRVVVRGAARLRPDQEVREIGAATRGEGQGSPKDGEAQNGSKDGEAQDSEE